MTHAQNYSDSLWDPVPGNRLKSMRHMGRNWIVQHQDENGGQLSPRQKCWQQPLFLCSALPPQSQQAGARSDTPSNWLTLFAPSGDSLRPCFTQLSGPPMLFPVAFLHEWLVLANASDFPKFSQTSRIWLCWTLYLSLSCPRPGTRSSWRWVTTRPLLGTSKPSTSSIHLQIAL